MLDLSKFFSNDIVGDNQTLKPIILITDPETNNVLFTLTQDKEDILDNNGNKLDIISSISKVSSIRLSTDYDSKKLKINRLRCTLYNYYDVNTKLSEYINTSITNKNLYLFYKSPTTNVLNTTVNVGDYDCALIYKGEVSRIEFNSDSLTILAEDKTQIKISNKKVPYMSVDRLDDVIKKNLTEQYKENNDLVVPMTFGKVDKAPTITYYSDGGNELNVLLDTFPTLGKHRTSKVPYMLNHYLWNNQHEDYMLYSLSDDDYLIINTGNTGGGSYEELFYQDYQYNNYSRFVLHSQVNSDNTIYAFPELSENMQTNPDMKNWSYTAFNVRQAIGAVGSDGSIVGVDNMQVGNMSNANFYNEESLTDNGNYSKIWYRQGDTFEPNVSFYTNYKTYNASVDAGSGRWIIFRMEKGASNQLFSRGENYGELRRGNTYLLCDSRITKTGTFLLPDLADRVGWFVAVISAEILNNIGSGDNANKIMNKLLVRRPEDLEVSNPNMVDNDNPYENAPIYILPEDSASRSTSTYWGNLTPFSGTPVPDSINGYKFGHYSDFSGLTGFNADEENLIAMFEYFPQNWETDGSATYRTKLELNNFALLHRVVIQDVSNEEIFASISGRRNFGFTEQIDQSSFQLQTDIILEDIPYSYFLAGTDISNDVLQSDSRLINTYAYKIVVRQDTYENNWLDDEFTYGGTGGNSGVARVTYETRVNNFIENETWSDTLSSWWSQYLANDVSYPAVINTFSLYKYVFKMFLAQSKILYTLKTLQSGVRYDNFKSGPLQNALDLTMRTDGNMRNLWNNEDWIKGFYSYAYEYILQRDIPYAHNYTIWVDYATRLSIVDDPLRFRIDTRAGDWLNITDKIAEYKQYNWNDFTIVTFGDFLDNFYIYMDDLVQAFSRALIEDYQDMVNRNVYYEDAESVGYGEDNFIPYNALNMEEWADANPSVLGLGALDTNNAQLNAIKEDLGSMVTATYSQELEELAIEESDIAFTTDGMIEKPSDIVMNILTNELGYGKYDEEQDLAELVLPDYDSYDLPSIELSREIHSGWKMGFSVHKKIDGKKLIEQILAESQSYPRFKNDGKFGLINIKNSYTRDDIDKIIDTNEILSYKFTETKREDIITSCKMFYRYDYGLENYPFNVGKNITDLLADYDTNQTHQYYLKDTDGHKDINLKYHTDTLTVGKFLDYKLLNQCNTHNLCNMKLPLNYMALTVGDIIHFPLINNEKIFNIDYSVVDYKNTQPIYPLWIIMETNVGVTDISIKAYQLHYLGDDGVHGFV